MAIPGINVCILRRTYPDLFSNHIQRMLQTWPELAEFWKASERRLVIPHPGGESSIWFRYADSVDLDLYRVFQGQQFAFIFVDEATQWSEQELRWLLTCLRDTSGQSFPDGSPVVPKIILTCNPGGLSHAFIKRVFVDRKDLTADDATFYAPLLQSYGWDNVEWVRRELETAGLADKDYYGWTEDERRAWFLRSMYGKNLLRLPRQVQLANLWGRWDEFSGQFFDCWSVDRHTYSSAAKGWTPHPAWWTRWISGDWGFAHDGAYYLLAWDGTTTYVEDEVCRPGMTPKVAAEAIIGLMTQATVNGRARYWPRLESFYLSPDAFRSTVSPRTIADEMADVISARVDWTDGMEGGTAEPLPTPTRADDDRSGGAMLVYSMLLDGTLKIDSARCPKLVACIPNMQRNPKRAGARRQDDEDVLKVDGDDPYDSLRYGLKSRPSDPQKPIEMRIAEQLSVSTDVNGFHMRALQAEHALRNEEGEEFSWSYRA